MRVTIEPGLATFQGDSHPLGEYVLDDPFKPHFRSLRTPAGRATTLVSPGDHRHHKGLMYALRCEDLNFWEENPGSGQCGVQSILSTRATPGEDGVAQELLWREEGGSLETYRETRLIRGRLDAASQAFVLTWRSEREALRDHRLVKSPWSIDLPDGRKINYHGLGIRLPWMWRFPSARFGGVEEDGTPIDPAEACGSTARSVGFWGVIDGQWERSVASVTIAQQQDFAWFVLKRDFPYLAVGPSNAEEIDVARGRRFDESYTITIADRPSDFGMEKPIP